MAKFNLTTENENPWLDSNIDYDDDDEEEKQVDTTRPFQPALLQPHIMTVNSMK